MMSTLKIKGWRRKTKTGRWSFDESEVETREISCRDIRPVKTPRDLSRSLSFLNYVGSVAVGGGGHIFHISEHWPEWRKSTAEEIYKLVRRIKK